MSDPVEQLVQQAQSGSYPAASELITQFYQLIFAYLRRLSGNDEDASDLTQKTFLKVWASLESFAGKSSFSTWLHGIAYHVYVDWRRQKNPTTTQSDEWWAACPSSTPTPFETAAECDTAARLFVAVERLNEEQRSAVHLHYYQGLSLAETAEALGVAASTVKYRLREAIQFLRSRTAEPKLTV